MWHSAGSGEKSAEVLVKWPEYVDPDEFFISNMESIIPGTWFFNPIWDGSGSPSIPEVSGP